LDDEMKASSALLNSTLTLCFCLGAANACGGGDAGPAAPQSQAGTSGVSGAASTSAGAGAGAGASASAGAGQAGTSSLAGTSGSSGSASTGGLAGTGATGTGGAGAGNSAGGTNGSGGAAQAGSTGTAGSTAAAGTGGGGSSTAHFSFFVTSLEAIVRESKSDKGFGGNLGGLAGADAICTRIAEAAVPGSGAKGWRAFLSTTTVNAIERIGSGPWYDRNDKLVASNTAGLLQERPAGETTVNDLPNELGLPNRAGTGTGMDDNHDTITASNTQGKWDGGATCDDWTLASGSDGPRVGHSWPANSGKSWMQAHTAPGCAPSVALMQTGGGSGDGIGNGGGYGGFYCFALMP
jgi:hypothetical protein